MKNPVKITYSGSATGKVRVVLEIEFPNEPGEEQTRAFNAVGRLLSFVMPEQQERELFLAQMEEARRTSLENEARKSSR